MPIASATDCGRSVDGRTFAMEAPRVRRAGRRIRFEPKIHGPQMDMAAPPPKAAPPDERLSVNHATGHDGVSCARGIGIGTARHSTSTPAACPLSLARGWFSVGFGSSAGGLPLAELPVAHSLTASTPGRCRRGRATNRPTCRRRAADAATGSACWSTGVSTDDGRSGPIAAPTAISADLGPTALLDEKNSATLGAPRRGAAAGIAVGRRSSPG